MRNISRAYDRRGTSAPRLGLLAAILAPLLLGAASVVPTTVVGTNQQLAQTLSYQYQAVLRLGVDKIGDAPGQWFMSLKDASGASLPCPIAGGDVGTQVPTPDKGCLVATPIGGPRDIREWGAQDDGLTGGQGADNDPTGTFDSTAALNAACASGDNLYFPPGRFHITGQLICHKAQTLQGAGVIRTYIDVGSDFNMVAVCAVSMGGAVPGDNQGGVKVADMKFLYYQPTTAADRTQLIHYPPVMCPSNNGRMMVQRVQFARCWDGIWSVGNFVWNLDFDQFGCFDSNIHADGALDYQFWDHLEIWDFGAGGVGNLTTIWNDGQTQAMYLGRNDGLEMGEVSLYRANILVDSTNILGTGIRIGKLHLDSPTQVAVKGGALTIGEYVGGTFVDPASSLWLPSLIVDDGNASSNSADVVIGTLHFWTQGANAPPTAVFQVHSGRLTIGGGSFQNAAPDAPAFLVDAATGPAYLRVGNLTVTPYGAGVLTHPMFQQQQAAGSSFTPAMDLSNIYFTTAAVGQSGTLVSYLYDTRMNALSSVKPTNWPNPIAFGFNTARGYYDACGVAFPLTAALSFGTNGNFTPTINSSYGSYHRCGDFVDFDLDISFDAGTYTGASGSLQITAQMPPALATLNPDGLPVQLGVMSNFTFPAGTMPTNAMINGASNIAVRTATSGAPFGTVGPSNLPSGTTGARLVLSGRYRVR